MNTTTTVDLSPDLLSEIELDAKREGKTVEHIVAAVLRGRRKAYYGFLERTPQARWWWHQLKQGRIDGYGESWPAKVNGTLLHASYVMWCESNKIVPELTRISLMQVFMVRFVGPRKKTRKAGQPHQYRYLMSLKRSRQVFDEMYGTNFWTISEEENNEAN